KGVGERNERGERRRLKETDGEHRPKPIGCEVQERGARGQNGAHGKFCSKDLETIREPPANGTTNKPQRGCRTEHEPNFLGPEPASRKKGRRTPSLGAFAR